MLKDDAHRTTDAKLMAMGLLSVSGDLNKCDMMVHKCSPNFHREANNVKSLSLSII